MLRGIYTRAGRLGQVRRACEIRATDGSDAFRRYFPKYTRSNVTFTGVDRFVYTDLAGVNVLRVE